MVAPGIDHLLILQNLNYKEEEKKLQRARLSRFALPLSLILEHEITF